MDKKFFSSMRRSACFINLGRGSTVNQADLIDALQAKTIRALVSDVYEEEPLPEDSPLWHLDNVILTPHVASNTVEANFRVQQNILQNIERFLQGRYEEMTRVV